MNNPFFCSLYGVCLNGLTEHLIKLLRKEACNSNTGEEVADVFSEHTNIQGGADCREEREMY